MIIKNANVFHETGEFLKGDIFIAGDQFTESPQDKEEIDASELYAIPGLVDVHQHGCVQHDYSDADIDGIIKMIEYQAKNGVTSLCPTTMTLPLEHLERACTRIADSSSEYGSNIVGINLEGPFISPQKTGAQNPAYIVKPQLDFIRRLQKASKGLVKLLAIAPEEDGAMDFIEQLHEEVIFSLAHTTADYQTAIKAFEKGAYHVTHLYNAMPPLSHREPGVIGAACDTPNCYVELICDNIHIHPSVVRATFRMFGDDRIVMISDSMMATGMEDGLYELGGLSVEVQGRTARLTEGGAIAGSVTNLMKGMIRSVQEMNIPLESAIKCATVNPAKSIGVFDKYGSITPGKSADLVLLNKDLSINKVFLRGKSII